MYCKHGFTLGNCFPCDMNAELRRSEAARGGGLMAELAKARSALQRIRSRLVGVTDIGHQGCQEMLAIIDEALGNGRKDAGR